MLFKPGAELFEFHIFSFICTTILASINHSLDSLTHQVAFVNISFIASFMESPLALFCQRLVLLQPVMPIFKNPYSFFLFFTTKYIKFIITKTKNVKNPTIKQNIAASLVIIIGVFALTLLTRENLLPGFASHPQLMPTGQLNTPPLRIHR